MNRTRERRFTLQSVGLYNVDVRRVPSGFVLQLFKGKQLMQTARALNSHEVPLSAAAMVRDLIPEDDAAVAW